MYHLCTLQLSPLLTNPLTSEVEEIKKLYKPRDSYKNQTSAGDVRSSPSTQSALLLALFYSILVSLSSRTTPLTFHKSFSIKSSKAIHTQQYTLLSNFSKTDHMILILNLASLFMRLETCAFKFQNKFACNVSIFCDLKP